MQQLRRVNLDLERLVDRGIELDMKEGSIFAWVFMKRHGISEEIIFRVLAIPTYRRHTIVYSKLIKDM